MIRHTHVCADGWVCEEHTEQPEGHDGCDGIGMPCPICQPAGEKPRVSWDELYAAVGAAKAQAGSGLRPYNDFLGIEPIGDLWTLRQGERSLRCEVITHPMGWELRIWSGETFLRSQVCKTQDAVFDVMDKWRDEATAKQNFERMFITRAHAKTGYNVCKPAKKTGLHRTTLSRKMAAYKIRKSA